MCAHSVDAYFEIMSLAKCNLDASHLSRPLTAMRCGTVRRLGSRDTKTFGTPSLSVTDVRSVSHSCSSARFLFSLVCQKRSRRHDGQRYEVSLQVVRLDVPVMQGKDEYQSIPAAEHIDLDLPGASMTNPRSLFWDRLTPICHWDTHGRLTSRKACGHTWLRMTMGVATRTTAPVPPSASGSLPRRRRVPTKHVHRRHPQESVAQADMWATKLPRVPGREAVTRALRLVPAAEPFRSPCLASGGDHSRLSSSCPCEGNALPTTTPPLHSRAEALLALWRLCLKHCKAKHGRTHGLFDINLTKSRCARRVRSEATRPRQEGTMRDRRPSAPHVILPLSSPTMRRPATYKSTHKYRLILIGSRGRRGRAAPPNSRTSGQCPSV